MTKKKYIKNFMFRDKQALMSISRCGHVSHYELKNFIADSRIRNYCRDGLVEKEVFNTTQGERLIGYKLTKYGKDFIGKNYGFTGHQHAQSIIHDLGISQKYFSLSETERETWRTETELRDQFQVELDRLRDSEVDRYDELYDMMKNREISMPDCSYTTTGGITITFEVITNSYGRTEIQAKEQYAEVMNTTIEYWRV